MRSLLLKKTLQTASKIATQIYHAKTVAVNTEVDLSNTFAKANPQLLAKGFLLGASQICDE